jgi:hypothetical protein
VDKDCKLMFCCLPALLRLRRLELMIGPDRRFPLVVRCQRSVGSSELGRVCLLSSEYGRDLTNYITAWHKLRQGITKTHKN